MESLEIGQQIRRLRMTAGLTGSDLGAAAGLSQSKISRIERGRVVPTVDEMRSIVAALDLDVDAAESLLGVARAAEAPSGIFDRSITVMQDHVYQMERSCLRLDNYSIQTIPGLLQTKTYVEWVLRARIPESMMDDYEDFLLQTTVLRMTRQALLHDSRKRFRFVVPDAVLRSIDADIQRQQLLALRDLNLPHAELRILETVPTTVFPLGEFVVFDDSVVYLESNFSDTWLRGERQTAMYVSTFEECWNRSLSGDAVREYLNDVVASA